MLKIPLELKSWINNTKDFHLRIHHINSLEEDEIIEFLILDNNLIELVKNFNCENDIYDPEVFFRNCHFGKYKHIQGMQGIITLQYPSSNNLDQMFNFYIEYKENSWHPLYNDMLLGYYDNDNLINYPKNWKYYPINTRIGWNGPIILKKNLNLLPKIYWSLNH